ncbi:MAG: hypothetical protein JNK78_02765 [Planctomycetes bacterium]|nr:hypothetical protein [Planctomycetota bacterium]
MTHPLDPTCLARSIAFLAFAAGGTVVPAQSPAAPQPTFALRATPIAPGPYEIGSAPTTLWASGADYKASFHDGFVFYPFVGGELQHQPFGWRTVSMRAGEHELLAGAHVPAARVDGFSCSYDFGPLRERYEVRDDGVEQTFVVTNRPPAGDLVVVGEVTTPLRMPNAPARHGSLSLCLPDGRTVVEYGAAFAVDADGVRTPITTAVTNGRIELRVAAEIVARAAFPLVLDPLVGNVLLGLGANDIPDIDVLHENQTPAASQAGTWYAWTLQVAAGDRDLRLWRVGTGFAGTIVAAHEAITLEDDRRGSVGFSLATGRVVLAYQHFSVGIDANVIRIHTHDITNLAASGGYQTIPIPTLGGFAVADDTRPDVGGSLDPVDPSVLIVFQRDDITPGNPGNTTTTSVFAQVANIGLWGTPGMLVPPAFAITNPPDVDQERPSVNQTARTSDWLVAFQELDNSVANDDWDIEVVAFSPFLGTATGLATAHAADVSTHTIDPEIAGSSGRYLLTYTTRAFEQTNPRPSGTKGSAVHAQRIDWDAATSTGSLPHPVVDLLVVATDDLENGGNAFDRVSESHWCATLSSEAGGRFRIHKLGYTGNVVEALPVQLAAGFRPDAIAVSFDSATRQFPIVYSTLDTSSGASLSRGTVLEYASAPPPATVGFACGSGVWAGVGALRDRQQVGSENASLRLTGAPENTVALLIASTVRIDADGGLIGATGCTIVPDLASGLITVFVAPIHSGNSEIEIDLPEAAGPAVLYLQWAYFATGANPLNLLFSEGLRLDANL